MGVRDLNSVICKPKANALLILSLFLTVKKKGRFLENCIWADSYSHGIKGEGVPSYLQESPCFTLAGVHCLHLYVNIILKISYEIMISKLLSIAVWSPSW